MVALAVIGLLLVFILPGINRSTKVERFSGAVREFANLLKEAQTKAYSIQTGSCANPGTCFWRGNVIELDETNDSYAMYLLYGQDMSPDTGIVNQTQGLIAKQQPPLKDVNLGTEKGIRIERITLGSSCDTSVATVSLASIAFLAPDGKSYSRNGLWTDYTVTAPYTQNQQYTICLRDDGTGLLGSVTINTLSGMIRSEVK